MIAPEPIDETAERPDAIVDDAAPAEAPEEQERKVPAPDRPTLRSFPESRPCDVLVYDGDYKMYAPVFPRTLSLESCEGVADSPATIEFVHETAISVGGLEKLESSNDFMQTPPIPLYHAHVLWSYTLRLTRKKDAKCALSLVSIGPHLGIDNSEKKGALGRNEPAGHCMPRVLAASLTFLNGEEEKMELTPDRGGTLSTARQFAIDELPAVAGGPLLKVRVRLVIGRAYFELAKMVNLTEPTGTGSAEGILDLIVRGERSPGTDWAITVAESDSGPSLFHVHRKAFASASDPFRAAFCTGHSYEDQVLMCTGENRCIVPALTAEDMRVVIPLVYGLFAPLPANYARVSALGRALCRLFKADLIRGIVFPQWERAICEQALALDKSNASAAFPEILRLLTIVWSCPYGAMPTAKRVAIGVVADMVHLSGSKPEEFLKTALPLTDELACTAHTTPILASMCKHLALVSSVRKTGSAASDAEWK